MYDMDCIETLVCFSNSLEDYSFVMDEYKNNLRRVVEKLNKNIVLDNADKKFLASIKQDYIPVRLAVAINQLIGDER